MDAPYLKYLILTLHITYKSIGPYFLPSTSSYLPITVVDIHRPVAASRTPTVDMTVALMRLLTVLTAAAVARGHAVMEVPTPRRVSATRDDVVCYASIVNLDRLI